MKIRKSRTQDINRIMEIYEIARDFMGKHGNPKQREPTNWPPKELITKDLEWQ